MGLKSSMGCSRHWSLSKNRKSVHFCGCPWPLKLEEGSLREFLAKPYTGNQTPLLFLPLGDSCSDRQKSKNNIIKKERRPENMHHTKY